MSKATKTAKKPVAKKTVKKASTAKAPEIEDLLDMKLVKAHEMYRGGTSYVTLTFKSGRKSLVLSVKAKAKVTTEVRKA